MTWHEWKLVRGGEVLAYLHCDGKELVPGLDGHFTVEAAYELTPDFDAVRHLFEREVELLDVDSEPENTEWADIWDELQRPGLFLHSADDEARVALIWIHFQYGRAWWWPIYSSPESIYPGRPDH